MSNIILRDYQKIQLNFIEDRIHIANVVGIQSPTGSGKTITFLAFIKQWMEKPENQLSNVVISTGFNNLVFLLEEQAHNFGFENVKVLIGTKACNCPVEMEAAGVEPKIFTQTDEYRCGDKHKHLDNSTDNWAHKVCPFTTGMYREHIKSITSDVGQLIITNHSSLLIHQETLSNTSLLIIDEAHTFSVFYDSFLRLELNKNDLIAIDESISTIKQPMQMIIKKNIERGVILPSVQVDSICDSIKDPLLRINTREFFETIPSYKNWIEKTNNSYTIDRFYKYFEFNFRFPKTLLFSATLDDFTLNMFNVRKSNFYREHKTFCDYSQSEFIAIPSDDYKNALLKFLDYVDKKNLRNGLVLSTTITDMNIALKQDGYNGYKMYQGIKEFENAKGKKILVGSRALFQGIDIMNLDFVCLNKIPFPTWDEKNKALQNYLTDNGKNDFDPWNSYTVPKTENDMIQSLGRLWRTPESKGVVSIFDPRIEKFRYMMRHVFDLHRHGIKTKIIKDDEIIDFPLKD